MILKRPVVYPLILLVNLFSFTPDLQATEAVAPVHAWEDTLSIPTYPWGPDDINPRFEELEQSIIYPYPMQDTLSTEKKPQNYRALFLENEFLKVTCLPELGGRIHSVLDKTTGQEMFDRNEVIKPGLIGMRGAWLSGGVEWNTGPHIHTVTAVSPVNAMTREDPDGSATLFISNTEQIFRTRWSVQVTLYPGKAYLHEKICIENPTDGVHPYYFWNCTAFPCLPGTRFIYPMSLGTDHFGQNFFHWPIDKGRDMTWLRNYDGPASVFAYKCDYDFFGAYDVDRDQGLVHVADHKVLPGKKAWTWGQSGDGIVSQKSLTDDGGQYIEVQSGPLLTQSDYGLLKPHQRVAWEEYWYPVHGLGEGFEFATRDVAIESKHGTDGRSLDLAILATSRFPSAQIHITPESAEPANHPPFTQSIDLSPSGPVSVHFDNPSGATCTVEIISHNGESLASFKTPLPIPKVEPPEETPEPPKDTELSVEQEYAKALLADKATDRVGARQGYERVLAKDASHVSALIGLAVLDLESGLYEKAETLLQKAVELQPENGEAWYFLGVVQFKQDKLDEAKPCAEKAAALLPERSIGPDLAGRIQMRKKQYDAAVASFKAAVDKDPMDDRAQDHLLMALWCADSKHEASTLARDRVLHDPTALLPQAIHSWLAVKDKSAKIFEVFPWMGDTTFEVTEMALTLEEMGLCEDAHFLISEYLVRRQKAGLTVPSSLHYYIIHLVRLIGAPFVQDTSDQTTSKCVDWAFPSRTEEVPIYQGALQLNPNDAAAHLLLGNLLAGLIRVDEAVPHWEKAAELDPKMSTAFRNLGLNAWKKEKDLAKAESLYRKAIAARPSDQVVCRDLASILVQATRTAEAINLIEGFPLSDIRRNDVLEILARAYITLHRFDDTIKLLGKANFSNWEGQTSARQVWVTALLERGKASLEAKQFDAALADFEMSLTYPENLGVGRPVNPDESEPLYWKGQALAGLGKPGEARQCWGKGAAGTKSVYQEKCKAALEAQ